VIRLHVNAKPIEVAEGAAVADLVVLLTGQGGPAGVAVARNGTIVPRSKWAEVRLLEGDTVDVVRAVQGG
jgi:sulfur carrier protein